MALAADASDPARADADYVVRVREGNERAFEALFLQHFHALARFARSYVRSQPLAEELVQDVFLRIWAQRSRWEVQGSIRAYLFGAVRNGALDLRARADVRRRWEAASWRAEADDVAARAASSDEHLYAEERAAALRRAVERLPENRRVAFTLRWHHQLSYAEIASIMGISVAAAQMLVARSIAVLRTELAAFR